MKRVATAIIRPATTELTPSAISVDISVIRMYIGARLNALKHEYMKTRRHINPTTTANEKHGNGTYN